MNKKLPITFLMFATARGHYGCNTIYNTTIDFLNSKLPLNEWGALLFHIKIAPGEEKVGEQMKADLESRGFIVETEIANWKRGQSHFCEYLKDQIKMSQHPAVRDNPFVYWSDDDNIPLTHSDNFLKVLHRMVKTVESSQDIVSFRFLRENDTREPIVEDVNDEHPDFFYSRDFNWQPLIIRSRDFHRGCKVIEDNWHIATQMHGEGLWREVTAPMSRSKNKHAVWHPKYAEVANLGVPNYAEVASRFNLNIKNNYEKA
jgi:hypothetical protein